MKKKEAFAFWRKVRDTIDKSIVKKHKSSKKHHLTRFTGEYKPTQYVVLEDGTEAPYTMEQEAVLKKALILRREGEGDSAAIWKEVKRVV